MVVAFPRPQRLAPTRTGIPPTWLRGTNYLASTALGLNNVLGTLPILTPETRLSGFYWGPYVEQEIAELARAGFNNVRLHTASFLGWALDPGAYLQSLAHLARTCARHEITVTYQFWTTTSSARLAGYEDVTLFIFRNGYSPQQVHADIQRLIALNATVASPLLPGKPGYWLNMEEPGPTLCTHWAVVPREWKKVMMDYVATIADFFANTQLGRSVFGSYDLFNEPDVYDRDPKTGTVRSPLRTATLPLILDTDAVLSRVHPNSERTIGFASLLDQPSSPIIAYLPLWLSRLSTHQTTTYLSFHADITSLTMQSQIASEARRLYGLPIAVSEFWHTVPSLNQTRLFWALKDAIGFLGAGGQMWGYLESNVWDSTTRTLIDGIVKPVLPPSRQLTERISFSINHPVDHAAVLDWTSKKPTRRH